MKNGPTFVFSIFMKNSLLASNNYDEWIDKYYLSQIYILLICKYYFPSCNIVFYIDYYMLKNFKNYNDDRFKITRLIEKFEY